MEPDEALKIAMLDHLKTLGMADDIEEENSTYPIVVDKPYLKVSFLIRTENPHAGSGFFRLRGYMQVDCKWPAGTNGGPAGQYAALIRRSFFQTLTLEQSGVTVSVDLTPEVGAGRGEDDRWVVPVFVYFHTDVFGV